MPDAYPRSVKVGGALARSAGVGSDASRARVNGRCILYDWFRPRAQTGEIAYYVWCHVSYIYIYVRLRRVPSACRRSPDGPADGRSGTRARCTFQGTYTSRARPMDVARPRRLIALRLRRRGSREPCGDWCSVFRFPVGRRVLLPTCTPATGTRSGCGVCDARMSDFVSTRTARSVPANGRIWLYRVCAGRDEVAEGPT